MIQTYPTKPPQVYATASQDILGLGTKNPGAASSDGSDVMYLSRLTDFDIRLHPKKITKDYVDELAVEAEKFRLDKEVCPDVTNKVLHKHHINLEGLGARVSRLPANPEFQQTPIQRQVDAILAWEKILALYEKAKARQGPSLFRYNNEIYIVHERISDRTKPYIANAVLKEARGWDEKLAKRKALEILEATDPQAADVIKNSGMKRISLFPTARRDKRIMKNKLKRLQKIIEEEFAKGIPPDEVPNDIMSRAAVI